MDDSGNEGPILPDDMGEFFKEVINPKENLADKLQREQWKIEEKLKKKDPFHDLYKGGRNERNILYHI